MSFRIIVSCLLMGIVLGQGQLLGQAKSWSASQAQQSWTAADGGLWVPQWEAPISVANPDLVGQWLSAPAFEGMALDEQVPNLPYYLLWVPVSSTEQLATVTAQAENVQEADAEGYQHSTAKLRQLGGEWYPTQTAQLDRRVVRQGQHFQGVRLYPLQVSSDGRRVRKAQSIRYRLSRTGRPNQGPSPAKRTYAAQSVLATGNWYKLAITEPGIFELDWGFFQSLGIDPASIDPRTLRIYGNGGGMLPQVAGEWQRDDLVENAIQVQGETDGSFDNGDRVWFYAEGPHTIQYNEILKRYHHRFNLYSDTAFYYLTWGNVQGKRIINRPSLSGASQSVTETPIYLFHEQDKVNLVKSGRTWLGEIFGYTTRQEFDFATPNIVPNSTVRLSVRAAARSNAVSTFTLFEGQQSIGVLSPPATHSEIYNSPYYYAANFSGDLPASLAQDGRFSLAIEYSKPLSQSVGYLDYIGLEYRSALNISNAPYWTFRVREQAGPGQVLHFSIAGGGGQYQIWDITDLTNVVDQTYSQSGGNLEFQALAEDERVFWTFRPEGVKKPRAVRAIPNQDIHGQPAAEYLLITHPQFRSAAQTLADFHRHEMGHTVHILEIQQIYNEFSSGRQDPVAIRDCIKMFYDRHLAGGQAPKYVLLMGEGSYDFKARQTAEGTQLIPTYQARVSNYASESFVSDDFYGFLEDGDGLWGEKSAWKQYPKIDDLYYADGDTAYTHHDLQVAIGRLPVATEEEAQDLVDKIIRYRTSADALGAWRNRALVIGDHKDDEGNQHSVASNLLGNMILSENPVMNVDKVFLDNYPMEVTASGSKFPAAVADIEKYMNQGSLIVNYTGHGGEVAWSNSSILDIPAIEALQNDDRMPLYVTATCEFGRWDDPNLRSGAEHLLLKPEGGAIAMLTTVRVVYSNSNDVLNRNFYRQIFVKDPIENRMPTVGEAFMRTKNNSWGANANNRNFSLLGDPGLPLAYPKWKAVVETINGLSATDTIADTLGALSLVTMNGSIQDDAGQIKTDFQGEVQVTVFDKPMRFTTRRVPFTFYWQKTRLFNGTATVRDGRFSLQFVVPLDISYEDGMGKISLYAKSMQEDAAGADQKIAIGGNGGQAVTDDQAPELDLYMNDPSFVDGGMVDPDPVLLAEVFDENGINTAGTGIGHELTATLDGNSSDLIVLNDYYTAEANSYQRGTIRFPFQQLAEGEHTLEVKVWDVANHSAKREIRFLVADDASAALGHVLNYPNPFTTHTQFLVEHNLNGHFLHVQIKIFTVGGTLVKRLEDHFMAEGNLYRDMEWDGLDDYGDALGRGVYVYQVSVTDQESGERIDRFEKLVMLR